MCTTNPFDGIHETPNRDVKKLPLHRLWEIAEGAFEFAEADTLDQGEALDAYKKFKMILGIAE